MFCACIWLGHWLRVKLVVDSKQLQDHVWWGIIKKKAPSMMAIIATYCMCETKQNVKTEIFDEAWWCRRGGVSSHEHHWNAVLNVNHKNK